MSRQLKKLIWKHFWKQKNKELKEFLHDNDVALISISIIIPIVLQILGWGVYGETGIKFFAFLGVFGLVILGSWALYLILYLTIYQGIVLGIVSLYKWLNSNWKLARKNAKAELKKLNKKK